MKAEELLQRYQAGERDFQGIHFRIKRLEYANLSRANFSNAHFLSCGLRGVHFDHSVLRNATIVSGLRRASFRFCDLKGAVFCKESYGGNTFDASHLDEADLTSANLAHADLRAVNFQNAILTSASLVNVDLRGADLRRANLQNADLTNANLSDASLYYANLSGALLTGANITDAKLASTVLPDGTISPNETLSIVKAKVSHFKKAAWRPLVEIRDGDRTASKFAGHPWLGTDEVWPICPKCQEPMQFFLQLNLDELPTALTDKFGKGLLQFFYCTSDVDCEGWPPYSGCKCLRIIQPEGAPLPIDIPEIQSNSLSKLIEGPFQPQVIVGWQKMDDYPNLIEVKERQRVSVTDDELLKVATDRLLEGSDCLEDFDDFSYADERERCYIRDRIVENFMLDAAMIPFEGDKLAGWPYWVQDVEYPKCPTCDRLMDTLIFEFASDDHVPYLWGDVGTGYILQCPEHKEQVAFLWQC